MSLFEKIIVLLQAEMERPQSYGWFHILWLFISAAMLIYFYVTRTKNNDKRLKRILLIYGITSFLLELIKQVIWSYDNGVWDYQWYAFPFQLCTTPLIVSIAYCFIRNEKIKEYLLSYLAFFTILGGISTMIIPDSCFVKEIEVNIYTMFLHCGSFVISTYILMGGYIEISFRNLINGFKIFLMFVSMAFLLNIVIYNSGILNGETFNMFYISPYFISSLPVFSIIQPLIPYILFLVTYILALFLGAFIIYIVALLFKKSLLT